MILKFSGKVSLGDAYRCGDGPDGAVRIGEDDLVDKLMNVVPKGKPVTVAIADERFEGPLSIELGWGYSEWTPMDSDSLLCGPHNILEKLKDLDGQNVTVWVADEPVNVLDG